MAYAFGIEVRDLPEGATPLEVVAVVTYLDETGRCSAVVRSTEMQDWEIVGLLRTAEQQFLASSTWIDEED